MPATACPGEVDPVRRSRTCATRESTALPGSRHRNKWFTMTGKRCSEGRARDRPASISSKYLGRKQKRPGGPKSTTVPIARSSADRPAPSTPPCENFFERRIEQAPGSAVQQKLLGERSSAPCLPHDLGRLAHVPAKWTRFADRGHAPTGTLLRFPGRGPATSVHPTGKRCASSILTRRCVILRP